MIRDIARWPARCVLLMGVLACAVSIGAEPATQPASRPAKPAKAPPPVVVVPTVAHSFGNALYQVNLLSDGNLANLRLVDPAGGAGSVVLGGTVFGRAQDFTGAKAKMSIENVAVTRLDDRHAQAVYAVKNTVTGAVDPQALFVTYTFSDAEVTAELKARPAMNFGLSLADSGQIVENLQTLRELALPAARGATTGGPLQSIRILHADASELLFRWTGPGNTININENGNVLKHAWAMRGNVTNATYVLTFRPVRPAKPARVLASPQFEFKSGVVGNIFFAGESPAFDLKVDPASMALVRANAGAQMPGDASIVFTVSDHTGAPVDRGAVPIDFAKDAAADGSVARRLTLKPLVNGYYELSAQVQDGGNVFRPVAKAQAFSVVSALKSPEADRAAMVDGGKFDEWSRNAFIGLMLMRCNFGEVTLDADGKVPFTPKMDDAVRIAAARAKATGVNYHHMLFEGKGLDWATTPQQLLSVYEQIIERYKDQNKVWETLNEPNITWRPQDYVELYLKPLKLAAKKVDPEAIVVGGSICGLVPEFLDEMYRLGAKDYMDAVSLHPYIGVPYDIQFIPAMDKIRAVMAKYGDEKKPVWFTECGFGWNDLASQVRNARHNIRRLGIQEQYGIPNDRDFYYFTSARGYHRFNVMQGDGTMLPPAVALRARRVLLDGVRYEQPVAFSVPFVLGNVYRGTGRTMLQLWTFDTTRAVELKGDVAGAQAWDVWGNPKTVDVKGDTLSVVCSGEPTYVRLAEGARVTATPIKLGRNMADLALGADATASGEFQPAELAMDGRTFGGGWADNTPSKFPVSYEVSFPLPTLINRVHVYMPESSAGGCIRDVDVLGWIDGKYVTLREVRSNRDALLEVNFDAATVQRIKLQILAGNEPRMGIYELQAFSPDDGKPVTPWTNWASAENGARASASSTNSRVAGAFSPAGAIDGMLFAKSPKEYGVTTWIDDTPGEFPDWLQVDFAGPRTVSAVLVYTNNFNRYRPSETGISDAELQAWINEQWQTVGSIKASKKGVLAFTPATPIETGRIRLMINGSNDGYKSTVMEIQALGSAK